MSEMEPPVPGHHWFHIPLQLTVAAFWFYWYWHTPAPNKAVLWLGGVAALMLLVEMRPIHKAIYFILVIGLMFMENRAIDNDRANFARDEAYRRAQENKQFSEIGTSISVNVQKLLDQSDTHFLKTLKQESEQFAATMQRFQVNVDEITGGSSYVVVYPDTAKPEGRGNTFPLMINVCSHCQYSVPDAYVLLQRDVNSSDQGEFIYKGRVNTSFGVIVGATITPNANGETFYRINVEAPNKPTTEILRVRFSNEDREWQYAWQVWRQDKPPRMNVKTRKLEGQKRRLLEEHTWDTNFTVESSPIIVKP